MSITLSQSDYQSLFDEVALEDSQAADAKEYYAFPAILGQGHYQTVSLREGLELVLEDSYLWEDVILKQDDRNHPLEYTFEQCLNQPQCSQRYLLYGSGMAPQESWCIPGRQRVRQVNVHIEPDLFCQWLGDANQFPETLTLLRSQHQQYYEQTGTPTATMQMAVQQILNCPFQGPTRRLYLESKVWELMALLIDDLHLPEATPAKSPALRTEDIERIHYAGKLLRQRLCDPPSLMELARATGINDCKLKRGFRQVFGTTVFGYLHELRLERSRQLLEAGDLNVTEAAQLVGFTSRGHFAAAFRRKYGVNPGVYLRQKRA